jgi:hypothetical protein
MRTNGVDHAPNAFILYHYCFPRRPGTETIIYNKVGRATNEDGKVPSSPDIGALHFVYRQKIISKIIKPLKDMVCLAIVPPQPVAANIKDDVPYQYKKERTNE